ncbi:DNA primase domain protein [Roseobacter sp. AzwK-3b]|uniref:DUF927 domain-containing protein n=1 Tax=Roseobacter sp. AzwK-3b TaxID=351016 RepID=UPI000156ADBB|nr:DUF927 domain-containing protein [Roseobacter sp. AzwK-3b]EDM69990.1 DNA primase domain protein [Roseobacter sp. AzwK-3b]
MGEVTPVEQLRKETEAAKAASAQAETMALGEIRYTTWDGCFHMIEQGKKAATTRRLSNFTAEIVEEVTEFDGATTSKVFRIIGRLETGQPLPEIDIPADQLDQMAWITQQWGSAAQPVIQPRYKDHILAAIKQHSRPKQTHVALHTGWLQNRDEHIYLTGSGAITQHGLDTSRETRLHGSLKGYDLPAPDKDEISPEFLQAVIRNFAGLLKHNEGLLCLGAVVRAVVSHFEPAKVSLYLAGITGARKSAIAGVLQSFFGPEFDGSNLPANWSSTGNSLEKTAFLAKDALFVVDDFLARGTPAEVARMHKTAEQLIRGQANQAGRQRLSSTAQLREAYHSRGLILATGEDVPNGHSLQARMVQISIDKDGVDLNALSELQEFGKSGELAQILSNCIQWLATMAFTGHFDGRTVKLWSNKYRRALGTVGHARTPDNLANLLCGLKFFLLWAKSAKLIDEEFETGVLKTALIAAKNLAVMQAEADHEASDAQRYIDLLRSALQSGRGHVASLNGLCPHHASALGWREEQGRDGNYYARPQGDRIGWVDDSHLYVDSKAALSLIKKMSNDVGNYLGSSDRAISKALKEAGWLAKTEEKRNTFKVTCESVRRSVLCFDLGKVMELVDEHQPVAENQPNDLPF